MKRYARHVRFTSVVLFCLLSFALGGMLDLKSLWPNALIEPEGPAFVVKKANNENALEPEVVSLVDGAGNLRMKGYLLVQGVPYSLKDYADDPYWKDTMSELPTS